MKRMIIAVVVSLVVTQATAAGTVICHRWRADCVVESESMSVNAVANADTAIASLVTDYFDWPGAQLDDLTLAALRSSLERVPAKDGSEDIQHALALAQWGAALLLTNDPANAVAPLREAVGLLRKSLPRDDPRLIAPFALLGTALARADQPAEGAKMLARAQNVTHLRWGTNNPQQIPLIYQKAEALQADEAFLQAKELYQNAYQLTRSNFGDTSPEAILAADKLGTWLHRVGAYRSAISVYREALLELRGDGKIDPPEAVPLLLGKAYAYLGGRLGSRSYGAYRRVLEVMDANTDQFDANTRVQTHMDFGDLLLSGSRRQDALKQYKMAWFLASEGGLSNWLERLARPELIRSTYLIPRSELPDQSEISFAYQLAKNGHPYRIRVQATDYEADVTKFALSAFRHTHIRPPFIDGKATGLSDQVMAMNFAADKSWSALARSRRYHQIQR